MMGIGCISNIAFLAREFFRIFADFLTELLEKIFEIVSKQTALFACFPGCERNLPVYKRIVKA
jgi:hypothetical protein